MPEGVPVLAAATSADAAAGTAGAASVGMAASSWRSSSISSRRTRRDGRCERSKPASHDFQRFRRGKRIPAGEQFL